MEQSIGHLYYKLFHEKKRQIILGWKLYKIHSNPPYKITIKAKLEKGKIPTS